MMVEEREILPSEVVTERHDVIIVCQYLMLLPAESLEFKWVVALSSLPIRTAKRYHCQKWDVYPEVTS